MSPSQNHRFAALLSSKTRARSSKQKWQKGLPILALLLMKGSAFAQTYTITSTAPFNLIGAHLSSDSQISTSNANGQYYITSNDPMTLSSGELQTNGNLSFSPGALIVKNNSTIKAGGSINVQSLSSTLNLQGSLSTAGNLTTNVSNGNATIAGDGNNPIILKGNMNVNGNLTVQGGPGTIITNNGVVSIYGGELKLDVRNAILPVSVVGSSGNFASNGALSINSGDGQTINQQGTLTFLGGTHASLGVDGGTYDLTANNGSKALAQFWSTNCSASGGNLNCTQGSLNPVANLYKGQLNFSGNGPGAVNLANDNTTFVVNQGATFNATYAPISIGSQRWMDTNPGHAGAINVIGNNTSVWNNGTMVSGNQDVNLVQVGLEATGPIHTNIFNTGTMSQTGTQAAISINAANGSLTNITNAGMIFTNGNAINETQASAVNIVNDPGATIKSNSTAINLLGGGHTIYNAGTIASVSNGQAINLQGGGNTIYNTGTIATNLPGGAAILMQGSGNNLSITSTSNIQGTVIGGTTGGNTLNLVGSGGNLINGSQYQGFNNVIDNSTGIWTFTGTTGGNLQVNLGTVALQNNAMVNGSVAINQGTNLVGSGVIQGNLRNAGTIYSAGNTLTVNGAYQGAGGILNVASSSAPPALILQGPNSSASGTTFVNLNTNFHGPSPLDEGMLLLDATNGATSSANAFTLNGSGARLNGGAFDYSVNQGDRGGGSNADSNNYYVRANLNAEDSTYTAVQGIGRQMGQLSLGTLDERMGAESMQNADGNHPGVWARMIGEKVDNQYSNVSQSEAQGLMAGFQAGIDFLHGTNLTGAGTQDHGGLYVSRVNGSMDISGLLPNALGANIMNQTGQVNLDATSVGASATHFGASGWYVDGVVQGTSYGGNADSTGGANLGLKGTGIITSLEAGVPLLKQNDFTLTPQAQVLWQKVSFDNSADNFGNVNLGTTQGVSSRLGLKGQWNVQSNGGTILQPYLLANFWHDSNTNATTTFGADSLVTALGANRGEIGTGFTAQFMNGLSVYSAIDLQKSLGDTSTTTLRTAYKGDLGIKYSW